MRIFNRGAGQASTHMMLSSEFFLLAGAHLLALASPGPISSCCCGQLAPWARLWAGCSLGIALANGLYIALAIGGFSLLQRAPLLLAAMQWLAAFYLAWLGWIFWRAGRLPAVLPDAAISTDKVAPWAALGTGFLSAALNPKNGVFYFGLFTVIVSAQTGASTKFFYGIWMFGGTGLGCGAGVFHRAAARDARAHARCRSLSGARACC
jgi:threonine/homoserine/homoserine lactone efflux protein